MSNESLPQFRGKKDSPILIVGDSFPNVQVGEVLDRAHPVYNSIILPMKYYLNEYLIMEYGCKLPGDFCNNDDIFYYVNAIRNKNDKGGLEPETKDGKEKLKVLKNVIFGDDGESKYKIIICLGDFAFFAVRSQFLIYYGREQKRYCKSGTKYGIQKLGEHFSKNSEGYIKNHKVYVLPVLHNSANRQFDKSKLFVPEDERDDYLSYHQYVAEKVANILINDPEIKRMNYFIECH